MIICQRPMVLLSSHTTHKFHKTLYSEATPLIKRFCWDIKIKITGCPSTRLVSRERNTKNLYRPLFIQNQYFFSAKNLVELMSGIKSFWCDIKIKFTDCPSTNRWVNPLSRARSLNIQQLFEMLPSFAKGQGFVLPLTHNRQSIHKTLSFETLYWEKVFAEISKLKLQAVLQRIAELIRSYAHGTWTWKSRLQSFQNASTITCQRQRVHIFSHTHIHTKHS